MIDFERPNRNPSRSRNGDDYYCKARYPIGQPDRIWAKRNESKKQRIKARLDGKGHGDAKRVKGAPGRTGAMVG